VHEVSPVLIGAGVGTHTVAVKSQLSFTEEADHALGSVEAFIKRAQDLGALRADTKEGRVLNAANRRRLEELTSSLGELAGQVKELLRETDPNKHRAELEREFLRYQWALTHI